MIRAQILRNSQRMLVQGDQDIRGEREKFFWLELIFQQAREVFVAKIFQQQKTTLNITRQNLRHTQAELTKVFVDLEKRRDRFPNARSVHKNGGLPISFQAKISSCRSVARDWFKR